jgi:uncharacterized membrane protein
MTDLQPGEQAEVPRDLSPAKIEKPEARPASTLEADLVGLVTDPESADRPRILERVLIEMFGGPIPPPQMLQDYEAAHPGTANRIVANWEAESVHRRQLERDEAAHRWGMDARRADIADRIATGDIRRADRGQLASIVLHGLMISGGIVLLAIGVDIAGYATLCGAIASGLIQLFKRSSEPTKPDTTRGEKKE